MQQASIPWDVLLSRLYEARAGYHRQHLTAERAGGPSWHERTAFWQALPTL